METIDLKKEAGFVDQYIELRNRYAELLLTSAVEMTGTRQWLKRDNVEIRGIADGGALLGVVILYLDRDNEIAFFAREGNRGIGSKLLSIIESVAVEKRLGSMRAWVLEGNIAAKRTFEKNGFKKVGEKVREYKGMSNQGIEYKKILGLKR